jgi:uncharacterized protein YutE (UPF0331/DUF86 family)
VNSPRLPLEIRVRLVEIPRHYRALGYALEGFADADDYGGAAASDDPEQLIRAYTVERPFELLETYLIELAQRGLVAAGVHPSGAEQTGRRALRLLGEHDVIPATLCDRLIEMHDLRNQLVHEYPDLRATKLFVAAGRLLPLVQQFVRRYLAWMDELGYAVPVR